jgi:hypothetical protein
MPRAFALLLLTEEKFGPPGRTKILHGLSVEPRLMPKWNWLSYKVSERKDGKLDVTWRLADAKWAGLMTMNKVTITQMIRLRLPERDRACRAVDIIKSLRATADGLSMGFSFSFSFFREIILGQWEYEKQYGLIFKDGGLTFDTVYEYKFRHDELKNPIVNIVVQSGWEYKPVMFISKILGG